MRPLILATLVAVLCGAGCDDSTGPRPESALPDKELHYTRTGTWSNYIGVAVLDDGTVLALIFGRSRQDTVEAKSRFLTPLERARIADLLESTESWEMTYPSDVLDDFHSDIRVYCQGRLEKQVSLDWRSPSMPEGLAHLVMEAESLWKSTWVDSSGHGVLNGRMTF